MIISDYYQTLILKRNCTEADIRLAYRKLALQNHPERNNSADSANKFLKISEAFDVLSDVKRRAIYDQYGSRGLSNDFEGFPGGYSFHQDAEMVFNQFFGTKNPFADFFVGQVDNNQSKSQFGKEFGGLYGMSNSNSVYEPKQSKPAEFDLNLTLEEMYLGAIKKIKITRKILNDDGMTTSAADKILTIKVLPGWKEGTKVVFARDGDQGPNKIPADIIFTVRQIKHTQFTRKGDNLHVHSEVPLIKALVGYGLDLNTLDGRRLRIPINDTITPNYVKVIKGEGMPNSKTNLRGDLQISFSTSFPVGLSFQQKNLLKEAFVAK